MKTRNLLLALTAGLTLTNCAEDVEKLAKPYLTRAQESYANKQYALAKLQIDSIKQLYPKAFETRAQAQVLLIEVELAEARASKLYTDSLLAMAQEKAATLATSLYLDKDTKYQDYGSYYAAQHRVEKNVGKSYLRPQANALLIDVELSEARTSKYYTDSLLTEFTTRATTLAAALYLDKDTKYQDYGSYYAAQHRVEKNVGKSYLRPQANEQDGAFTITAYYRGKPIGAHTLRFTAPDDSYVEMKPITEPHVMSDATGRTERTDFATTPEVAHFVAQHASIKVTLIGKDGKVQMPFSKADAKAFIQVADLSAALQSAKAQQLLQQELDRRIKFYEQRQAQ